MITEVELRISHKIPASEYLIAKRMSFLATGLGLSIHWLICVVMMHNRGRLPRNWKESWLGEYG